MAIKRWMFRPESNQRGNGRPCTLNGTHDMRNGLVPRNPEFIPGSRCDTFDIRGGDISGDRFKS
jgi:hypothetical protein